MHTENKDGTLYVSQIRELTAGIAPEIKNQIRNHFSENLIHIDFDCSDLDFIDSSGLGALISMQKLSHERGGKMRLLSPKASVVQVLELTRLHRVFEMVS